MRRLHALKMNKNPAQFDCFRQLPNDARFLFVIPAFAGMKTCRHFFLDNVLSLLKQPKQKTCLKHYQEMPVSDFFGTKKFVFIKINVYNVRSKNVV